MNATILDGIIISVMLVFAVVGIRRGLIHRLVSIAAWVGGALGALWGFQPMGKWLNAYISPSVFAYFVAAFGIFIVIFSFVMSLRHALSTGMRHTSIGVLDRGLGLLFGLAQGLVLVSLFYWCFISLSTKEDLPHLVETSSKVVAEHFTQASLYPVVDSVARLLRKGAIAISSIEEIWPELDPSFLPGPSPEQPPDVPETPATEERSGFNESDQREFGRLF